MRLLAPKGRFIAFWTARGQPWKVLNGPDSTAVPRLCYATTLVYLDEQLTRLICRGFPEPPPTPLPKPRSPPVPCYLPRVLNPFRTSHSADHCLLPLGFRPASGFVLRLWPRLRRASSSLSSRRRCWAPRRRRRRSAWSSSTPCATPPPRSARYSPIRCALYAGHSLFVLGFVSAA